MWRKSALETRSKTAYAQPGVSRTLPPSESTYPENPVTVRNSTLAVWIIIAERNELGNRDVAPVAALQSRPRERQMYVTVLAPGDPPQV